MRVYIAPTRICTSTRTTPSSSAAVLLSSNALLFVLSSFYSLRAAGVSSDGQKRTSSYSFNGYSWCLLYPFFLPYIAAHKFQLVPICLYVCRNVVRHKSVDNLSFLVQLPSFFFSISIFWVYKHQRGCFRYVFFVTLSNHFLYTSI